MLYVQKKTKFNYGVKTEMNNQSDETIDIIRILMDERCDIQFANIQNKEAH